MNVAIFLLAVGLAWACLKLYDLPVREWLKRHWLMKLVAVRSAIREGPLVLEGTFLYCGEWFPPNAQRCRERRERETAALWGRLFL